MALTIRKAVATDAADIANIHICSWEVAYTGIIPDDTIRDKNAGRPAMWQNTLSNEHNFYIALAGETPVGLMGIHPCLDDDLSGTGEIGSIYLHPVYWGKGYGCEMMEFALETLNGLGLNIITLWVLEDNLRAIRFYEKCGFTFDGTKKEITYGKPLVEVRCRKNISLV